MSRPVKATVDYFSHNCNHGRVLFVMQDRHGNDGYVAFYKIYELLGTSEEHFYDCKKPGAWSYMLAYLRMDSFKVHTLILTLIEVGVIDSDLWHQALVIWSQPFVDDLDDLYSRRTVNKPVKPDLCQHKPTPAGLPPRNEDINPQMILDNIKETKKAPETKAPEQPAAPSGEGKALLSLKKVFKLEDHAIKAHLNVVCDKLYKSGEFPQADAFKNKCLKQKYNPKAILHALVRCSVHARDDPWGFCTKVIKVENGNYNEQKFMMEAQKQNVSREDAASVLAALGFEL